MSEEKKIDGQVEQVLSGNEAVSADETKNAAAELILGKFKSVDDLKTAYQNLQKQQGDQSVELGELRKMKQTVGELLQQMQEEDLQKKAKQEYVNNYLAKYDNENYFQNDAFKQLYSEAFKALGTNLDTDLLVNKLEEYVASRILLKEQMKKAQSENKSATDSLEFANGNSKPSEKKLRFQDVPVEDYEKYIAKYV